MVAFTCRARDRSWWETWRKGSHGPRPKSWNPVKEVGCDVAEPRPQGPDHGLSMLWGPVWGILKKKILAD